MINVDRIEKRPFKRENWMRMSKRIRKRGNIY